MNETLMGILLMLEGVAFVALALLIIANER